MAVLEKISTLADMRILMNELHRLEVKLLFDFYGVLQDFSSKKFLPQWLQKKSINKIVLSESGNEILAKVSNSKRLSVIIYDLQTPDLNGLQFLSKLGEKPEIKAQCKVILVIPKLTIDAQNKLFNLGASALVLKPIEDDDLKAAFEKVGLDY